MAAITDEIKRIYKTGGIVTQLIFFNVIAFVLIWLAQLIWTISVDRLELIPTVVYSLSLTPDPEALLYRPWSFFTHIFNHAGLGHLFFNMLTLYFFGRALIQYTSPRRFLGIYILSGLFGGLVYMGIANLIPGGKLGYLLGASGSIMGILGALVARNPRAEFGLLNFRIPILLIAGLYVLVNLFSVFSVGNNWGGNLAHLGGLGFGLAAVMLYDKGTDIVEWFNKIIDAIVNLFRRSKPGQPKMKVKYRKPKGRKKEETFSKRTVSDEEFNANKKSRQDRIDAILDKIKRSGYESLSKSEKDFLFQEGQNL